MGALPRDKIAPQQRRDPETFLARVAVIAEGPTEVGFLQYLLEKPLLHGGDVRQSHVDGDCLDASRWLAPLRACEWVVYAKRPFAGPEAVLAYLSRYTHRVAISNRRLVAMDEAGVTFRWKDYRAKGRTRHKTMTLDPAEFMRRFLLHVLPSGFHRIRHYGLLANAGRQVNLAKARRLLNMPPPEPARDELAVTAVPNFFCRCCGATMRVVEIILRRQPIRAPP